MRRFATPGIPDVDYAGRLKRDLEDHQRALRAVADEILTFFQKTIPVLIRDSPESVGPFYSSFTECGTSIAKVFSDFPERLQSLPDYLGRLSTNHSQVTELLRKYQGALLEARKSGSDAAIAVEKVALLEFVDGLISLNKDSNSFPIALLTVYSAASRQAVYHLTPLLEALQELQASLPNTKTPSAKESELATYLEQLEEEVRGATTGE